MRGLTSLIMKTSPQLSPFSGRTPETQTQDLKSSPDSPPTHPYSASANASPSSSSMMSGGVGLGLNLPAPSLASSLASTKGSSFQQEGPVLTPSPAPSLAALSPRCIKSEVTSPSPGPSTTPTPVKPKRMRTSKPKVKTGCSNCKQRRIKCDERRPSCFNCEKSRRQCAGYPAPSRSARGHEIVSIAPKPRLIASAPITPMATTSRAFPFPSRVSRSYFKIPSPSLSPSPNRHSYKLQWRFSPGSPGSPGSGMPSPTIFTPLYYPVPQPLQLLDEEVPYYQLFRSKTAAELSGYFDCVFWTQTVLRECHTSNAVKYSVIALGALYKTLEQSSESPPSSPIGSPSAEPHPDLKQHWTVAVNHYAKALGAIVHEMVDTQATKRLQLMTIVLLACFDSFIGDHRQAIIQIQTGLGLLDKLRKEQRRAFISQDESEPVEEELLQMFTRLAIQAKSYDMAFHFPDPYVVRLNQKPLDDIGSPQLDSETASNFNSFRHINLPQRFTCLIEARIVWDKMLETIFRFTETFFTLQRTNNSAPMGLLPARMLQYGMGFKDQLESWGIAYQHILMSRFALGISYQEKAGISVLKMIHLMTTVLFLMTFNKEETAFDQFENYFDAIVNLAAEVVGDEERRATTQRCSNLNTCPHRRPGINDSYTAYHIKPSFSADLGIVPPLYVVATKCRNPVIRRRAIRLLQSSSRREGMWDSQLSARIGEYIAMLEEGDGLGPRVWDLEEAPPVIPVPPSPSPVPTVTMPIVPPPNITPSTPLIKSPSSMGSPSPSTSSVSSPGDDGSPRMYSTSPGARYTQTASTPMFPANFGMPLYGPESVPGGTVPPLLPHVLPPAVPMLKPIPESKRLMVQAVEFDLRARFATLHLGTRGLIPGSVDTKSRYWEISW